jgi:thiol-disulfide isomerase/thioredoxin
MKRTLTTTAFALTLLSGAALAAMGPDHGHHEETQEETQASTTPEHKEALKLEDFIEGYKAPELFIGSKAPELFINKFLNGEPVDGFEKGQVYVVEFWATWCGPCVAAFPHLSELQAHYGDKVRFIGVNVWEGVDEQDARNEKVEQFVADQGERMSYTVAIEEGSAMADNWMKPAGQSGIPAAFVVDGTGHIAWIGHPTQIDAPIDQVLAGEFDATEAAANAKDQMLMMAGFQQFAMAVQTGEGLDNARQIANILIDQYLSDEPAGLNAIAWMLLTSESEGIGEADYKIAHRAIALGCEKTGWKDWSLLDTYALAAFKLGRTEEAIKWEKKALELAPADNAEAIAELKKNLAKYEG